MGLLESGPAQLLAQIHVGLSDVGGRSLLHYPCPLLSLSSPTLTCPVSPHTHTHPLSTLLLAQKASPPSSENLPPVAPQSPPISMKAQCPLALASIPLTATTRLTAHLWQLPPGQLMGGLRWPGIGWGHHSLQANSTIGTLAKFRIANCRSVSINPENQQENNKMCRRKLSSLFPACFTIYSFSKDVDFTSQDLFNPHDNDVEKTSCVRCLLYITTAQWDLLFFPFFFIPLSCCNV